MKEINEIRPAIYPGSVDLSGSIQRKLQKSMHEAISRSHTPGCTCFICLASPLRQYYGRSLRFQAESNKYINNIKEEEKKMGAKTDALINSLYENLKAVQVKFNSGGSKYTYKTFEDFEIGDYCVVESPHNGYVVVEVVGNDNSDLEKDYRFKWVVQKVNDSSYKKQVEKENKAIKDLSSLIAKSRRKEAIDKVKELVGDGTAIEKLTQSLNTIEEDKDGD